MDNKEFFSTVKQRRVKPIFRFLFLILILILAGCGVSGLFSLFSDGDGNAFQGKGKEEKAISAATKWETGYLSAATAEVEYVDETGSVLGTLPRGAKVHFETSDDGKIRILADKVIGVLSGAAVVSDPAEVIPAQTLYVRTAVNLRDQNGKLLSTFLDKGFALEITGCDYTDSTGNPHMYRARTGDGEGYVLPWYLTDTEENALANFDSGSYRIHADRKDRYGGGDAGSLDYFPREKAPIEGNQMPEECRTLYVAARRVEAIDDYISLAQKSGINAFVVDIADGGAIGYAADVMKTYCPSGAVHAANTVEEYKAAIQKLKSAGFYVIGRITTFNDTYFVKDHPECAIADPSGAPLTLHGAFWPTAFSRTAWQYKVDLAAEAAELMGFHEIQFDYVRFPDRTSSYEKKGTINFRNAHGETKAQAIQRFLMYATDILHEKGVYVSADVYGESAYTYVTAYGQYWPAISGVVDAISGMPYPDHFGASGNWLPWEHPYETLNDWGKKVMLRQDETENPAVVRTWIQAYNAIRQPYNKYGPAEISAQIRGLRDAGCTGGFITWNASASLSKYTEISSAFSS